MFMCLLRRYFASEVTDLSEGADRVAGQLSGDKECPFSGVTKSGRVWRKLPESWECGSASDITSVGGKHRT